MAIISKHTDVISRINQKKLPPLVLFFGEEDYFIDLLCNEVQNKLLTEDEKAFDFGHFMGGDIKDKKSLIDACMSCRQMPLIAPFRLVIIKEAQSISKWEVFDDYFKNPSKSTILVICIKGLPDKRKSMFKIIEKEGLCFESKPIKESELPNFVVNYLKEHGLSISTDATAAISAQLGTNLSLTIQELDKLVVNIPSGSTVSIKEVENYIGINKDYNVFTLQKAISTGDVISIRKILNYINRNPKPKSSKEMPFAPITILPRLYDQFSKIMTIHALMRSGRASNKFDVAKEIGVSPYFVDEYMNSTKIYSYAKTAQILSHINKSDLRLKGIEGSGFSEMDILEDLLFFITH